MISLVLLTGLIVGLVLHADYQRRRANRLADDLNHTAKLVVELSVEVKQRGARINELLRHLATLKQIEESADPWPVVRRTDLLRWN